MAVQFKFLVIGRSDAKEGLGVVITVSILAGSDGHLSYCGTLTMTKSEWQTLSGALLDEMPDRVEIEDKTSA